MNKLDALIASCKAAESGRMDALEWVPVLDIRRVLEAVREDMQAGESACGRHRCLVECSDCPAQHHAATRAALEQI